ncbi:MAG: cation-translocating P-type ATPase [Nanoarchaeota archaeon]
MHNKPIEQVLKELNTSSNGLTQQEADARLKQHGFNELKEGKKISPLEIFISQFKSIVVWILIAATVISAFLGEYVDAIVIFSIIILIALLGFFEEYRAEKAIEALKKLASLMATVLRDGQKKEIDAKELVPGDVIVLQTGDKVPADARLIEVFNLQTQEAALTGESQAVKKNISQLEEKTSIADRHNIVFSSTIVVSGRAKAVVIATGMQSEIGKIAKMIEEVKPEPTPLQKDMDQLGKFIGTITLIIAALVFATGMLARHSNWIDMLLVSVSLAVAAIPEALPAVVTISLALGTQKMLKRNALIRRLPSVETLGSTTVICTDKTGTLTANQVTVKKLYVNGKIIDATGVGYGTKGSFLYKNKPVRPEEIELLLRIGILNNNSEIKEGKVIGDPTEAALIVSAAKLGLIKEDFDIEYRRIDEIEFTSERKMMTTIHGHHGENISYVKGAPEVVLNLCNSVYLNGEIKKLSAGMKEEIMEANRQFAEGALRVLGFAYKTIVDSNPEKNLIFVGLQGMIDPPREEVKIAIEKCKKAGIRVIMITGDHEITARAIAKDIGLTGKTITGQKLDEINDLDSLVEEISIFARVNPEHKIRIVDALKKKGHIVAMTGDGINDAPALKKADIGVAMGISGTDVSKEASAMILTDDNFASIVNAVEEGRGIHDNIKKYFAFLVSGNIGEVLIIFISIIMGIPLPLTVTQILLINLAMDGPPAISLSAEPSEPDVMSRKPRNQKEPIYNGIGNYVFLFPAVMVAAVLLIFIYFYRADGLVKAQTMAFLTIIMFRLFEVFACRSLTKNVFKMGLFKNRWLVGAVALSFAIVVLTLYVPFMNRIFDTMPISILEFVSIVLLSSLGAVAIEISKFLGNRGKDAVNV